MEKQEHTNSNIDQYTDICVLRLFRNEDGKTLSVKKNFYLSSVVSYEEGHSAEFDWDGSTIYIVCLEESFYCSGDFKDFDKKMKEFRAAMKKLTNSSSGT